MTQPRRGFTLIELVVAMVIMGVLAMAVTNLLISQGRYYDHETNLRQSRRVALSSTNILLSDLRMVQDSGGIDSASSDGKLVRILVPYRFGLVCGTNGSTTTVSMLPADSANGALAIYAGFAWRGTNGRYTYITPNGGGAPSAASTPATCTGSGAGQAQIKTISMYGRSSDLLDVGSSSGPTGATQASPVFFWQRITYRFSASRYYPGKIGLYRNVQGATGADTAVEMMAPFDTSARFKYYEAGEDTSRTVVPALSAIRGIELRLNALSPKATSDYKSRVAQSNVSTSVFFKNVRTF